MTMFWPSLFLSGTFPTGTGQLRLNMITSSLQMTQKAQSACPGITFFTENSSATSQNVTSHFFPESSGVSRDLLVPNTGWIFSGPPSQWWTLTNISLS